MKLTKIARIPPVVVSPQDSVQSAVDKMCEVGVGAVAVVKGEELIGIFTERDLMKRVVKPNLSVRDTPVSEVMTRQLHVAPPDMDPGEAFEFMTDKHFRHLPLTDEGGRIKGMLSVRHLMRQIVTSLSRELEGMSAYLGADGPGGD